MIIDSASTIATPFPRPTGPASARTGGFELAIGLFNFYVDKVGVGELISMSDSTALTAVLVAPKYFGVYTQKKSTIASGDTPIGSAGRAPDADEIIKFKIPKGDLLYIHWSKLSTSLSQHQKFDIAIR
jgi:hypothetical protein